MGKIYQSALELIGHTPLLEVGNIESEYALDAKILVKLECFNPAGSVKDRAALSMIEEAEKRGKLSAGSVIIEPTSGNTGIGLAAIAAVRGLPCNPYDAGDDERGKKEYFKGIRSGDCSDEGKRGNGGSDRKSRGSCKRNSGKYPGGTV